MLVLVILGMLVFGVNMGVMWAQEGQVGSAPQTGETVTSQETMTTAKYFCPMHPQVRQAEPGNCPICGMPLEQTEATVEGSVPVEEAHGETEGHEHHAHN